MLFPEPEDAAAVDVAGAALPIREDRLPECDDVVEGVVVVWLMLPTEASGTEAAKGEDFLSVAPDSFEVAGEREIEGEGVVGTVATLLAEDPIGLRIRRWGLGVCLESAFVGCLGVDAVAGAIVALV